MNNGTASTAIIPFDFHGDQLRKLKNDAAEGVNKNTALGRRNLDAEDAPFSEFIKARLEVIPGSRQVFMKSAQLRDLFEAWARDNRVTWRFSWKAMARRLRGCGCFQGPHRLGQSVPRVWFGVREAAPF
jgi:hypothetical protein